uniref:Reverse transcriptase domain-containing protein n=1 Tax=Helianthus annuus TaxID=4232 RepID=A0A251TYL1_HELAN
MKVLLVNFSILEIERAVWDCAGDRAPGPDGFNFSFIKQFWDNLKIYSAKLFNEFHDRGDMSTGCFPSFVVLIPKIKNPFRVLI